MQNVAPKHCLGFLADNCSLRLTFLWEIRHYSLSFIQGSLRPVQLGPFDRPAPFRPLRPPPAQQGTTYQRSICPLVKRTSFIRKVVGSLQISQGSFELES